MRLIAIVVPIILITHRRSAFASAPSAVAAADIMSPFVVAFRSLPHDLPFVKGPGRRLPASGSFDITGFSQRSVAVLPHAIFRPLPGGSPMGADRPMFHASPPGGSLPIRKCVCDLPLPLFPFCTGLPPRPRCTGRQKCLFLDLFA